MVTRWFLSLAERASEAGCRISNTTQMLASQVIPASRRPLSFGQKLTPSLVLPSCLECKGPHRAGLCALKPKFRQGISGNNHEKAMMSYFQAQVQMPNRWVPSQL